MILFTLKPQPVPTRPRKVAIRIAQSVTWWLRFARPLLPIHITMGIGITIAYFFIFLIELDLPIE
jgi:hypothetical protein